MVSVGVTITFALIIIIYAGKLINLSFMEKSALDEEIKNNTKKVEKIDNGKTIKTEDPGDKLFSLEDISVKRSFSTSAGH